MEVMEESKALKLLQFSPIQLISLDKIIMYEKSGFDPSGGLGTLVSQNRKNSSPDKLFNGTERLSLPFGPMLIFTVFK